MEYTITKEKYEELEKDLEKQADAIYSNGKWFGYTMGIITGILLSLLF